MAQRIIVYSRTPKMVRLLIRLITSYKWDTMTSPVSSKADRPLRTRF